MLKEYSLTFTPITYWTNRKRGRATLLFLHAAFTDHTIFDRAVEYFEDRFNVITLDLPGHGKSLGVATVPEMSKYLGMLLQDEKLDKVHLIGVSLGGIFAQDFANRNPKKVASLNCFGIFDINSFSEVAFMNNVTVYVTKPSFFNSIEKIAQENRTRFAATPAGQEAFFKLNAKFNKKSMDVVTGALDVTNKFQTGRRMYDLLIAVGDKDDESMQKACLDWHQKEPSARYSVIQGAGNVIPLDAMEEFCKQIEEWFKDDPIYQKGYVAPPKQVPVYDYPETKTENTAATTGTVTPAASTTSTTSTTSSVPTSSTFSSSSTAASSPVTPTVSAPSTPAPGKPASPLREQPKSEVFGASVSFKDAPSAPPEPKKDANTTSGKTDASGITKTSLSGDETGTLTPADRPGNDSAPSKPRDVKKENFMDL